MLLKYGIKYQKMYYYCPSGCDIFISAHPSGEPVGTPAVRVVRELRKYAHILANRIWEYQDIGMRKKMYEWLEKHSKSKHIGYMETEELVIIINKFKNIIIKYKL